MSVRIPGVLVLFLVFAGCTSVRPVDTTGGDAAYSEVNRGVRGKVARVTLRDGSRMDVVGVRIDADSLSWLDRKANRVDGVPTREVQEVSVVKAGAGALRGLLVGVVVGAAAGGVRAAIEGDDPDLGSDPLAITQEKKYQIYPAAHAAYAALATTPLGAILGTRKIYRFESSTQGGTDVVVER